MDWVIYGYGKVSQDGRRVEPEMDPTTIDLYINHDTKTVWLVSNMQL
jgi:hypothetical protein